MKIACFSESLSFFLTGMTLSDKLIILKIQGEKRLINIITLVVTFLDIQNLNVPISEISIITIHL